jgi:hypothetical protein
MKIKIDAINEQIKGGDEMAKNIHWFICEMVGLASKKNEEIYKKLGPDSEFDIQVSIEGIEVDFQEFLVFLFSQWDKQVENEVKAKRAEIAAKFEKALAQFMHVNNLIDNDEYFDKIEQLRWE